MINKIKLVETNTTNISIAEKILNEKIEFLNHKDIVIENITMNIINNQIVFMICIQLNKRNIRLNTDERNLSE